MMRVQELVTSLRSQKLIEMLGGASSTVDAPTGMGVNLRELRKKIGSSQEFSEAEREELTRAIDWCAGCSHDFG